MGDERDSDRVGSGPRESDWYAISPSCSHEEFLAVAKIYAREIVAEHELSVRVSDLSWEVSTRAKRRAGVLTYRDDEPESIRLAWRLFENRGWAAVAATIRHELIHAHLVAEDGDGSHSLAFERLAAELNTSVHCERFAEPAYWVECVDCRVRIARYRESKLVRNPDGYACGNCGGSLAVSENP